VLLPDVFIPEVAQRSIALRAVTSARISPGLWVAAAGSQTPQWIDRDFQL